MSSLSISRKLTFLIVVLIAPTIALIFFCQNVISNKIERTEVGITGLQLIDEVWQKTEKINGVSSERFDRPPISIENYFRQADVAGEKQDYIRKLMRELDDDKLSSRKRLGIAKKLIFEINQTANLTSILSYLNPELAINSFDRIPELSYKLETFARLGEKLQAKQTIGPADIMAFLVNAGQFKSVSDSVSRSTRSTIKGYDTKVLAKISDTGTTLRKQNGSFQGTAAKVTRAILSHKQGDNIELASFLDKEKTFDLAISNHWHLMRQLFGASLQGDLDNNVNMYKMVLIGLFAFLTILAAMTWVLRKSIIGQTKQLEKAIEQSEQKNIILKQSEQELIEQHKVAKSAESAKTEFLANMSHEIRTPMNGVMGMAELLVETELDTRQKMFADVIMKSGASLLTIINDILDFSKIDAGQMELDPAPFNMGDAISDVATLVSAKVAEKDLELIVRIDPSLPNLLLGDVGRIRQIVTNLLGNAVKFTEQGHVYVNVTYENSQDHTQDAVEMKVAIEDTGIGIPKGECKKVFQKFTQVDNSATRKHDGTGLGLSISSSLVELMNGEIGVESEVGKGSTFWFTLKLPKHDGEISKHHIIPEDIAGARILVIDDNAVNRAILTEQMAAWNFDGAAASSGLEGLQVMDALSSHNMPLDLVILDYQMPEMDGVQVLEKIRAHKTFGNIPVIMLTSVDGIKITKELQRLGANANLTKPTASSVLLETIVGVITSQKMDLSDVKSNIAALNDIRIDHNCAANLDIPAKQSPQLDVLVAEDNEVNQVVFQQILEQIGVNFKIVENGKIAFETFKQEKPGLILMDVSMPEMNGKDATNAIREHEKKTGLQHTPIIGVTAHALKGDMEACLDAGMDDYLSKPVSPNKMIEKIHIWQKKNRPKLAS